MELALITAYHTRIITMNRCTHLSVRSLSRLAMLTLILLALFTHLPAVRADGPTLSTDHSDYEPGDTVTYTGTGFQPGEVVSLLAVGSTNGTQLTNQATADDSGAISGNFALPLTYEAI